MGRPRRFLRFLAGTALLVLAALPGCSKHHGVTAPPASVVQSPNPDSPEGAIQLLRWSWENRDTVAMSQLLTRDFRFAFAMTDSTGAAFRNWALDRDEFLICVRHLFVGGGLLPAAQRIVLHFAPNLVAMPDPRAGKVDPWHKEIRTDVNLTIDDGMDVWRITGYARFFVVRGDSAAVPADLAGRGVHPDSTRWYIEQWNDETSWGGGALTQARPAKPQPTKNTTWGSVLALYW